MLLQYLTRGLFCTACQLVRKAINLHVQANGTCLQSEPVYRHGRHVYMDFASCRWSEDIDVTRWEALTLLRASALQVYSNAAIVACAIAVFHSSIILFCFRQQ